MKTVHADARMDLSQSVSGVMLTLILWLHVLLAATILFSGEALNSVISLLKFGFLTADASGYPWVISVMVSVVGFIVAIHVMIAMQKLPKSLEQQRELKQQTATLEGDDKKLWVWQAVTGMIILLLLPLHFWLVGAAPEEINAVSLANRLWGESGLWVLYVPLMLAALIHAGIGSYRVAIRRNSAKDLSRRMQLIKMKMAISIFFVAIAGASLMAFMPYVTN